MRRLVLLAFLPACVIDAPTFQDSDGGVGDDVIDAMIDATPADAVLATEQAPYDFGDVVTDEMSAPLVVTFKNTGTDPTGSLSVTLGGSNQAEFEIVTAGTDDCAGKTLDAEETCLASVRFAPGSSGAASAKLQVSADPGGTASVDISGNGLSPGSLEITVGAALPFSTIEIQSSSSTQTLTVHNIGGAASATLSTVIADPTSYSASNDSCNGAPLAGGASCSVDITFHPATVGSLPSQISVRESPTVGVAASATGTGTARLKVDKTGTGTVASSSGGLSCTGVCTTTTVSFSQTPVVLTATDGGGFAFKAWSGACSGTTSTMCSVPLTIPLTTIGATFVRVYSLDVSVTGAGVVTANPSGITCGDGNPDCSELYETGTMVTLTATPDANYEVYSWSAAGCLQGQHSCSVTMDQARTVSVEFRRQFTVTVLPSGSGSGTITGGGISCPGTCTATKFTGSMITLTEAPGTTGTNSQIVFGGWSGGTCAGTGTTCSVTFDADRSVDAAFTLQHRLSVTISGSGLGATTASGNFNCASGTCTRYYDANLLVNVTAKASNGTNSYFGAFSGACTGLGRFCQITMVGPTSVAARFDPQPANLVFVSSQEYAANLGGTSPYDSACNTLATAAGINTAANNGFIAWMTASTSLAKDRLGTARGFVRMDGLPFADDKASLLDYGPKIFYPVLHDENGIDPGAVQVFTGATSEGQESITDCVDWTTTSEEPWAPRGATGGSTHYGPGAWGSNYAMYCAQTRRILCLGKTTTTPITPVASVGKKIYVTNIGYSPAAGDPDAFCAASKPSGLGNVHAVIATSTVAASSKLNTSTVYVRPDGVLVGTGAQIIAGPRASGPWQHGDGTYVEAPYFITGSSSIDAVATDSCMDWTSSTGHPKMGRVNGIDSLEWGSYNGDCSLNWYPLLCVEE